jgi:hypothetical protein
MQRKKGISNTSLKEKAQKVFNFWIRRRDQGEPCISCGSYNGNQAGHYFPVKGFSIVRYDEINVNLQCAGCNCYQHGNPQQYRIGLVKKYGEDAVKALENRAERKPYKWTRDELEQIIKKYS